MLNFETAVEGLTFERIRKKHGRKQVGDPEVSSESCRRVRDSRDGRAEYIPELRPESFLRVGVVGYARYSVTDMLVSYKAAICGKLRWYSV